MIGNSFPFKQAVFFHFDLPFIDQLLKKCGMMDYFVTATEFRIFVPENIEAMRTSGYDFLNSIVIQNLDILISHHMEHKFIPCPSHRITSAHLFFTKYGVLNSNLI